MAAVPKISLERILAERHGDKTVTEKPRTHRATHAEYMRSWRKQQSSANRPQEP